MQNEIENDELIIDFKKIFRILNHRKLLIAKISISFILFFVILTFIIPKKYETDADIYINKSTNTNLADINPYVISSSGGEEFPGLPGATADNLQNEIEIMKSPLIMDKVIKENNLRYKKGKKKGELLSTKDFLKKNISIEIKKGSNVISISCKSKNPVLSYNVVNSIISNYQKVNEEINLKKATNDKKLLESSYEETTKTLNQKLYALKNTDTAPVSSMTGIGMLAVLKKHNKTVSDAMSSIQSQVAEGQKSQIAVDQEVEKLKLVKSKLEWANLVEKMSKDTTNVIILKYPEIKRGFEQSNPKLLNNLILGIIFAIFASAAAVIFAEKTDKTLTYSELSDKVIYDAEKNLDDLKVLLLANPKENFSFVTFNGFKEEILKGLDSFNNFKIIKADINQKIIDEILNSNKLIFAAKISQTSKKLYQQIKRICIEKKGLIHTEITC